VKKWLLSACLMLLVTGCANHSVGFTTIPEQSLPKELTHWTQVNPKTPYAYAAVVGENLHIMVSNGECSPKSGELQVTDVSLEGRGAIRVDARFKPNENTSNSDKYPRTYLRVSMRELRAEVRLKVNDPPVIALRRQSPEEGQQVYLPASNYECGK
jgi:hypothetical protein